MDCIFVFKIIVELQGYQPIFAMSRRDKVR